jgi:hypothetical protein
MPSFQFWNKLKVNGAMFTESPVKFGSGSCLFLTIEVPQNSTSRSLGDTTFCIQVIYFLLVFILTEKVTGIQVYKGISNGPTSIICDLPEDNNMLTKSRAQVS